MHSMDGSAPGGESAITHARIEYVNIVLRALRDIDDIIARLQDPAQLMDAVCETLLKSRVCRHAWIMLYSSAGSVDAAAEAGDAAVVERFARCCRENSPPPCIQKALDTNRPVLLDEMSPACPACPAGSSYDCSNTACIRLEYMDNTCGLLAVKPELPFAGDPETQLLLTEIARDLSLALYSVSEERMRKKAQTALRDSEERYRNLYEHISNGVVICEALDNGSDFLFVDFNKA